MHVQFIVQGQWVALVSVSSALTARPWIAASTSPSLFACKFMVVLNAPTHGTPG